MVATVGQLNVPNGVMNVIPERCDLSLDLRAGDNAALDVAISDIHAEMDRIARMRGVAFTVEELMHEPAVRCAAHWQQQFAAAIDRAGMRPRSLMSGAGHDAVMFDGLTDVGMLFVRCGNGGVSHSPLETVSETDAEIAVRVLIDMLCNLQAGP